MIAVERTDISIFICTGSGYTSFCWIIRKSSLFSCYVSDIFGCGIITTVFF